MKKKTRNYLIIFGLILFLSIIYFNKEKLPFKFVCTKYSWKECSSYTTQYDTCYQTCKQTITDCNKCGSEEKEARSGQKGICLTFECPSDASRCWTSIYSSFVGYSELKPGEKCGTKDCSPGQDPAKGECDPCYDYACEDALAGRNYYQLYYIVFKNYCKSCEETYQCNPYQCNPHQVCSGWTTKTGSSCPSGASDCVCVEGFETCGNGVCEPQYDENSNNCPADCINRICNEGEERNKKYCWDGKTLEYVEKCENNNWVKYSYQCPIKVCEEGATQTLQCPDGSIITTKICQNNNWVDTNNKCPTITPQGWCPLGEEMNCFILIFVGILTIILIGLLVFVKRKG
jgi:hypothetical protein